MRKIFTLLFIGLSASIYAQTNLVGNANFENGDDSWINSGAVSRTIVTPGHDSNQAFQIEGEVNKGAQINGLEINVPVEAYEVSFWAKGKAGEIAKFKVLFSDNKSVLVKGTFAETDVWEFFKYTYEQTEVKTISKFILQCGSGTAAAPMTFVADDLFYGVSATGVDPVEPVTPDYTNFPFTEDFESADYTINDELAKQNATDGEMDMWPTTNPQVFDRFWRGDNTTEYLATVDADAASGSKAMKIAITTLEGADFRFRTVNIPVGTYTVSFKAKTDASGVGVAKLGFVENSAEWSALTASYATYSGTAEVVANPSSGVTRLILFYTADKTVTGTQSYNIWIDDITIEEGTATSIEKVTSDIVFYPNPMQSELRIKTDAKVNKVEVFSLTGQKVASDYTGSKQVNVAGLSKGVYIVSVEADGQTIRKKVTKQ
ncbi:T9SS type A sorting domain-containing protein [Carboxylicivirga sediminis]|uniref:T9SS type A sorting domain-containing protein n=1 Tax=Carboxylicivirga sediminis TaxID=2006564 RepID=A0A941F6W4_9BACT|nr:T9SS type A sorting domain-containing protein [Carboxylicivirga sediminis]MBR8536375.1 T9SS type A sorting domain-containing protein [Carboxylicivirga sediminis]